MSQSANTNYIPGQPHQRYQSHQLQQHTVMTPHQNGTQISPGLVRRNQSVPPEVQYAGRVAPANQSQLVYAVSHDPPKMYQSTQSATNPQSIVFAQVPDPQMFSSQTGSQSPSPFRDSSQQQHQQQRLQVQQIRDQRQHEQHRLGAAVQPIPHLQGNEGVLEENGAAQRHRQRSPAVTGSELTAATTTARSSATACGQTLGASMSIERESIASLSSATLNVVGKQQHLNNSPITISPVDMPAAVSEIRNRDPPMDNGPSSAQLWTTPMNFVSESSSGERGPPVNNLSAAAVDRPEQTAAPSVMTDNLAQSSKSTIAPGPSPAKSSAKRVRKAPVTQATKPSKRLANKQAHGSQRLSEAATSTSSTADNENPTMKVQQLYNGESNIAVSPEQSSRVQSQKPAVQNDALSASMLSAYITSRSGAAEGSSESQDPSPGDYLVWARKLAYQATDAKKRFDSLTERLSMDEGKWGDLMQKHTTSVRKAVSELKRDVRDRATQLDNSTEQIQAVCISVKEYVAAAEERIARLDAAVMGLTSNIAELTSTVTNVMDEMSNGYRVASTQQESQMPKVAPTDTMDSSSPRGLKRARQQDHTQFLASKGISLPVRRTSEPLDRDNVRNDTLAEEKESPILRVQSEPIPNNEDDIAASIIGDDDFVPHYTIDTRRKLTSSSHPPSESFDEGFEIKPEVIGAVKPLAAQE